MNNRWQEKRRLLREYTAWIRVTLISARSMCVVRSAVRRGRFCASEPLRETYRLSWLALVVVVFTLPGCSRSDQFETARVHGTVTLDRKPYTQGGSVNFQPERSGKMATGQIESDGTYTLSTYSSGDGAIVGMHKVTVVPAPPVLDELNDRAPPPSSIPQKYRDPTESGLVFEVKPGQTNEFLIELKSD